MPRRTAAITACSFALDHGQRHVFKALLLAGADLDERYFRHCQSVKRALVDEIRAAGGWQNYEIRRRAPLIRAESGFIAYAFRDTFPEGIYAEIASFMSLPGDDD